MQNDFTSHTLEDAIRKATCYYRLNAAQKLLSSLGQKGSKAFSVWAPPLFWGAWTPIWAQLGVIGPEAEQHVSYVEVSYNTISQGPSSFDVEIKGGDNFVRTTGPGSQIITVTGNVATEISIRLRSHSLGQNVSVYVG